MWRHAVHTFSGISLFQNCLDSKLFVPECELVYVFNFLQMIKKSVSPCKPIYRKRSTGAVQKLSA